MLQVKALLLAASSSEVGPKGQGPHEPSSEELLKAAKALTKSRELLDVLAGKLAATQVPVRMQDSVRNLVWLVPGACL